MSEQKCLTGKMACRFETGGHQGTSLLAEECQPIGGIKFLNPAGLLGVIRPTCGKTYQKQLRI